MGPVGDIIVEVETDVGGFTRCEHRERLEREVVDTLQTDVYRCVGLTEPQRIDALASARDVPVVPHSGTTPHLQFIVTNAPMTEYVSIPQWYRDEQEDEESTYVDVIYTDPPDTDDGSLPLPSGVGLSSELNRNAPNIPP